jgi:SAM-dependent methyltransferase
LFLLLRDEIQRGMMTDLIRFCRIEVNNAALQVGIDDVAVAMQIAAAVGGEGHVAIVVSDPRQADRAEAAAGRAHATVDVRLGTLDALPFLPDSFDLVVVHAGGVPVDLDDLSGRAILCDVRRVLRAGGRVVILEGGARDLWRRLSRRRIPRAGTRLNTLNAAGFTAARLVAEREGFRVFEGVK